MKRKRLKREKDHEEKQRNTIKKMKNEDDEAMEERKKE